MRNMPILFTLLCALLLSPPACSKKSAAADRETLGAAESAAAAGFCSTASRLAVKACELEAEAERLLHEGRCLGLADEDEREECLEEAAAEFDEAREACKDQKAFRKELCGELGEELYDPEIDPAHFVEEIDHPFFPLEPGTTRIYEKETEDGTERIEVAVTFEKREILGVECTVVRDTEILDGEKIEETFDWYAQDTDGNVWYFGELSFEFEDGKVVGLGGSWEAGIDGAKPGIIMKTAPEAGELYRQEYLLGEAEDLARFVSSNEAVSVPYGDFGGCWETLEFTPIEPDAVESKFYAPGIGFVLAIDAETGEREELVEIFGLEGPGELEGVAIALVPGAVEGEARAEVSVESAVGLELVEIFGPEGDRLLELECLGEDGLGQRRLEVATPDAPLEEIFELYAEGEYRAVGWTPEGEILTATAELSHEAP